MSIFGMAHRFNSFNGQWPAMMIESGHSYRSFAAQQSDMQMQYARIRHEHRETKLLRFVLFFRSISVADNILHMINSVNYVRRFFDGLKWQEMSDQFVPRWFRIYCRCSVMRQNASKAHSCVECFFPLFLHAFNHNLFSSIDRYWFYSGFFFCFATTA